MRILILLGMVLLVSCNTAYRKYETQLEEGIASGQRYDSLFLELEFGMTQKEFFTTCWRLNKEGLIKQGPENLSVEYDLDELSFPGQLRFYPQFHEGVIYRMPCEISYATIVPNDERFSSTTLLPEVKKLMEAWYGEGFIYLENDESTKNLYVKIDGNRRIRIFRKDQFTVAVDITDMPVYLALNAMNDEE